MSLCGEQSAEAMIFFSSAHLCVHIEKADIWADAELVHCQKDGMTKGRTR